MASSGKVWEVEDATSAKWAHPPSKWSVGMTCHGSGGMSACVGGVPGVGKTTLLGIVAKRCGTWVRSITGSTILRDVIAPATVSEFDGWPASRRATAREEAARRLGSTRKRTDGWLLVDGHFTLRNRRSGRIEPIFTGADRSFYDALVLVEGSTGEILRWRARDARDRGEESPTQIQEHLAAERAEAARLSRWMGTPLLVISASDQERGAGILEEFLRDVTYARSSRR